MHPLVTCTGHKGRQELADGWRESGRSWRAAYFTRGLALQTLAATKEGVPARIQQSAKRSSPPQALALAKAGRGQGAAAAAQNAPPARPGGGSQQSGFAGWRRCRRGAGGRRGGGFGTHRVVRAPTGRPRGRGRLSCRHAFSLSPLSSTAARAAAAACKRGCQGGRKSKSAEEGGVRHPVLRAHAGLLGRPRAMRRGGRNGQLGRAGRGLMRTASIVFTKWFQGRMPRGSEVAVQSPAALGPRRRGRSKALVRGLMGAQPAAARRRPAFPGKSLAQRS